MISEIRNIPAIDTVRKRKLGSHFVLKEVSIIVNTRNEIAYGV